MSEPIVTRTTARARPAKFVVVALVVVALGAAAALGVATHPSTPSAGAAPVVLSENIVAQSIGASVALFHAPATSTSYATLSSPTSSGGPLVFLVARSIVVSHWLEVYLPTRPNGSRAWIHAASVQLHTDPYTVLVSQSRHELRVMVGTRAVFTTSVGVGRPTLPTPTGRFYVAELLQQPNPNGPYGPYAFGLSAHSNVLMHFDGGSGQIGLHGTNVPMSVGASVSHGCLRVSDAAIARLAHLLPLGTPVVIAN